MDLEDLRLRNLIRKAKHALNVGQVNSMYRNVQISPKNLGMSIIIPRVLETVNMFVYQVVELSSGNFSTLFASASQDQCKAVTSDFGRL
jgi:hypothetical protein